MKVLGTDPDTALTACPFCLIMAGGAVSEKHVRGPAGEDLHAAGVVRPPARPIRT